MGPHRPELLPRSSSQYLSDSSSIRQSTYPDSTRATQFNLQATLKLSRVRRLVRVGQLDRKANAQEDHDECANLHETLAWLDPSVLVRAKHSHNIVILVDRLAIVPPLLLVPPVGVRVSELTLDARGVLVATVLCDNLSVNRLSIPIPIPLLDIKRAYHARVLGFGKVRIRRVFLIDNALAGHGVGKKCSVLDHREPSRYERSLSQGGDPGDPVGEHLSWR
jgi:hypothetical protein